MSHIPHTQRREGQYVFRRRVHFRSLISKPVAVALQTVERVVNEALEDALRAAAAKLVARLGAIGLAELARNFGAPCSEPQKAFEIDGKHAHRPNDLKCADVWRRSPYSRQ